MAAQRKAEVVWHGNLIHGEGTILSTTSGVLPQLPVSWAARTEEPNGKTSPEDLIAAAHASCYAMELSHQLAEAGFTAETLETSATVTFQPGVGITTSHLTVRGMVPGMTGDGFESTAEGAKASCPVSQALAGVEITLDAQLAG
jgi:osmotically inducible protein OsmC